MSQLTNAALGYKAQAPVVCALLNELGLGGSLEALVSGGAVAALVTGDVAESTPNTDRVDTQDTKMSR
jgi:flotillin